MKTVNVDFNDFAEDGSLPLTCAGAIESLGKLRGSLCEGEEIWLTDGDLWVKARVFRRANSTYEARGDWKFDSVRPVDAE